MKKTLITLLVGVAAGSAGVWFSRPSKVKVVESVRVVEKEVVRVARDVVTKRITKTKSDGTSEVTETIVDKTKIAEDKGREEVVAKKTVTSFKAGAQIFAGVGIDQNLRRSGIAGFSCDFLGPVGLGVAGTYNEAQGFAGFGFLTLRF